MADAKLQMQATDATTGAPVTVNLKVGDNGDGTYSMAQVANGSVAAGATDSGAPIKIGGKFNSATPTLTDGQRGDVQLDANSNLRAKLVLQSTSAADADSNSLGFANNQAASNTNLKLASSPFSFNGSTWDRVRGNVDTTVGITAAGVTTTQTGTDQTNYNGRGVKVVLDMTTVGTGSVTLTIQGKDSVSGKYYTLLAGAAVTTNSTNVYEVYPGIAATANVSANATLPRTWRVVVTANNANATTYTVGASVIL